MWVFAEIFYARMINDTVLVSELNYPRIYALAQEVRDSLGLRKEISIFIYEQGFFNAALVKMFRRRAFFLNSEVLESGVSDDEVRWLVGRFVGYLRVQQDTGFIGWLVRVAERSGIFTLLIFSYARAMVYTGDRLGLAAINGDINSAVSTMQKLFVGRQLGYSVNPVGIIEQRRQSKGSIFSFLARIASPYPSQTARYVDLLCFAKRQYPQQYTTFEASSPGLPADLDSLSGEHTTRDSITKAIVCLVGILIAAWITVAVWGGLMFASGGLFRHSEPVPYPDDFSANLADTVGNTDTSTDNASTGAPDVIGNLSDSANSAAQTSAGDGHAISDPVFVRGPSDAQIADVYPSDAKTNGVTGTGTIQCSAYADGTLHDCSAVKENPSGSGFAAAALQLAGTIQIGPQDKQGVAVDGGIVTIDVTFS
jgi:hypothetical protein